MLADAASIFREAWWFMTFPGLALLLTVRPEDRRAWRLAGVGAGALAGLLVLVKLTAGVAAVSMIATQASGQLFAFVLYRYAVDGTVSDGFTRARLPGAFRPRRRGLARLLRRRR
jgi:hypothetical protein